MRQNKKLIAVLAVLAMAFVAVAPFEVEDSEATVGDGGTYTYVLTYDPTAMTAGTNAISTADMTPISHANTGVFEGMNEGSWTWDTTTGLGPFNSFYGAFDMTDGNKFYAVLNPYDLTRTISGESLDPISDYNIMWVLPTVYWKADGNTLTLSNDPASGGTAYAHTIDGTIYKYVAYGVYEGSTKTIGGKTVLTSQSGATPTANINRATFRGYAQNYTMDPSLDQGQGEQAYSMLWNFYQWTLYKMCCYAVMEDFNSQAIVGAGNVNGGNYTMQNGLTNTMGPYAGNNGDLGSSGSGATTYGRNAVKLFIENSWGTVRDFVDGVVISGTQGYYLDSSHSPSDSTAVGGNVVYVQQTLPSSGFQGAITTNESVWGMGTNNTGAWNTGLADYLSTSSTNVRVLSVGGRSDTNASVSVYFGLSYASADNDLSIQLTSLGARLAFVFGDSLSPTPTYTATFQANDGTYGAVDSQTVPDIESGTQMTISGNTITIATDPATTITATPMADTVQYDYAFMNWTVNGTPISGTVTIDGDITVQANFSRDFQTYTVNLVPNDATYGTVAPATVSDVPYGSTITINNTTQKLTVNQTEVIPSPATDPTGLYTYAFDNWSVSNGSAVNSTTFPTMAIGQPVTITASFSQAMNTYTVTIVKNENTWGNVSRPSVTDVPHGTTITVVGDTITVNKVTPVTITATPYNDTAQFDYGFASWSIENNTPVTSDLTVTANFTRDINNYTITIAKNEDWGTLSETSVTVPYGTAISASGDTLTINTSPVTTVTATPYNDTAQYDYGFNNWTNATGTVSADRTITANFTRDINNYTITIAKNEDWGTLSETSVTVPYGTSVSSSGTTLTINTSPVTTVTATPYTDTAQYDYGFVDWTGAVPTIEQDVTITANFSREIQRYVATIESNNTSWGTVSQGTVSDIPYNSVIGVRDNELSINGVKVYANPNSATVEYTYAFTGYSVNDGDLITEDTTIVATFTSTVRTYNVSFHTNDPAYGHLVPSSPTVITSSYEAPFTVNGDQITVSGQTYQAVPEQATAQYTFVFSGWYDSITGGNQITSSSKVMDTMDVYARFTANVNTYTVTISDDGQGYGTVSPSTIQNVPYGTVITAEGAVIDVNGTDVTATPDTDTAQYDYGFNNWTVSNVPIGTNGYTVIGNTAVTANFTRDIKDYTVTIVKNEDSWGSVSSSSVIVPYGTTITANGATVQFGTSPATTVTATPATPSAQYEYAFANWTNATGTVAGDMTVTANFSQSVRSYAVTVAPNNATYGSVSMASVPEVPYGTSISVNGNQITINTAVPVTITATASQPSDANTFAFSSWSVQDGATTTDSTSITANFTTNVRQYTVTWSIDGTQTQEQFDYNTVPSHSAPSKEHYTFQGWEPSLRKVTGDITYTAVFVPTEYTVTWDATGGSVSPATSKGTIETAVTVPTPVRDNYTFAGWFTQAEGGDALVTPYKPIADITYYAHWTPIVYTVTFDAVTNGGTSNPPAEQGTVLQPITLPSAIHASKYFSGWYTRAQGGMAVGTTGGSYTPTADITLYAQFTDDPLFVYAIYFYGNGGEVRTPSVIETSTESGDRTLTIPASEPYRYGYKFLGWSEDADASSAQYVAGNTLTVSANNPVKLYAVWEEGEDHKPFQEIINMIPLIMVIGILLGITAVFFKGKSEGLELKDMTGMIIGVTIIVVVICLITIPILNSL